MRIVFAYVSVVLLWATTPLAIKWSGEGPGFLFAATSRMAVGAVCMAIILLVLRRPLIWHRKARLTYLAVGFQIYASMLPVYWAAQFVPSGWISVIHGLCPLLTAIIASILLQENHLSISKLMGYLLGVYGLYVMFGSALVFGQHADWGILALVVSVAVQASSAVIIKRINANLPALHQVAGGLALAVPTYLLTWFFVDGQWPLTLSTTNIIAICYLGMIATTLGFFLYYYLLGCLSAVRVGLISLTTPVMALMLGHVVNREPFTAQIMMGTAFILSALIMHEVFDRISVSKIKALASNKNSNK